MNAMLTQKGAMAYSQVSHVSGVEGASPHQLIDMLLAGAIENISVAKGHMERNDAASKGIAICKAIEIIDGLRVSLDLSKGELAENLDALYLYAQKSLITTNQNNDQQLLHGISQLLTDLRNSWNTIPDEIQQQYSTNTGFQNNE